MAINVFEDGRLTFCITCIELKDVPPEKPRDKKDLRCTVRPVRVPLVRKSRVRSATRLIRATKKYKLWRLGIIESRGHRCEWCGASENLEVDHIKPASTHIDLIMADDNARVLCKACHVKTDSYPVGLRKKWIIPS